MATIETVLNCFYCGQTAISMCSECKEPVCGNHVYEACKSPTTPRDAALEGLDKAIESLRAGQSLEQLKTSHARLLKACNEAWIALNDVYDVDIDSEGHKEYPFSGAGDVMSTLKLAIDKAVKP